MYRKGNKGKDVDSRDFKSRKPSNRGKKPHANKKGKETDVEEADSKGKTAAIGKADVPYNALSYYLRDKTLISNASQLSFQSINGFTHMDNWSAPTIMRLWMNPSPGQTFPGAITHLDHPTKTGINMAALGLFNKLSMSSGRNMAYAPQDIATMLLAMSQLYAMHSYVRRLFGSTTVWNTYNRMFPKQIITAMGIDYDDFVVNYSNYRTRYNTLIAAVNQVPLILNIGYLEKSLHQYEYIFTDSDSPLSQVYLYIPDSTWVIDEQTYSGGTILTTQNVVPYSGTRTFADFMVKVMRPMVDTLLNSSTLNLVYADILNLASRTSDLKLFSLDFILEGITTIPFKNDEALLHIHNAKVLYRPSLPALHTAGNAIYTPLNDVYPNPNNNSIVFNPCFSKSGVPGKPIEKTLIDVPVSAPDEAMRIEMTRYISVFTNNSVTVSNTDYWTFALMTDYYVTYIDVIGTDATAPTRVLTNLFGTPTVQQMWDVSLLSQFDWHPLAINSNPSTGVIDHIVGDVNFWTEVPVNWIARVNDLIYMGLFELQ